jgi:hypothetical protein
VVCANVGVASNLVGRHACYRSWVPEVDRRTLLSACGIAVLAAAAGASVGVKYRDPPRTSALPASAGFVTRDPTNGDLVLDGKRFRWAGPNILMAFGLSESKSAYGAPTDADGLHLASYPEVTAAIDSARAMNARVIRHFSCLTVGKISAVQPSLGVFNDNAMQPIDYALSLCAAAGIKLIVPLVDNYNYFTGGKFWYCKANGVTPDSVASQFFTNAAVIDSFKEHVRYVLTHVNRFTGVAYKDDPAILAWETGNELTVYPNNWSKRHIDWTEDIARHIKVTLGARQLVVDGHTDLDNTAAFTLPHVDMYSSHAYNRNVDPDYVAQEGFTIHSYGKAFFVGEYTWTDKSQNGADVGWTLPNMLSAIERSPYVDGDNFWSLCPTLERWSDGFALHYPGDDETMATRARQLADHAQQMQRADAAQ